MRGENYKADLLDDLRNDEDFAGLYLSAAYADSPEAFLSALRNVAEARKGIATVASKAKVNRESLYRMLSAKGNPEFNSLTAVLKALGIKANFSLEPTMARGPSPRRFAEPVTEGAAAAAGAATTITATTTIAGLSLVQYVSDLGIKTAATSVADSLVQVPGNSRQRVPLAA